jgi:hypothetical protein
MGGHRAACAIARALLGACAVVMIAAGCASSQPAANADAPTTPHSGLTGRPDGTRAAHPHPVRPGHRHDVQHFAYAGLMVHGCVDGDGSLTVYTQSEPRSICLLGESVLRVVLSPAGSGRRWLTPRITGRAVRLSGFHRVGTGARFVLTARGPGEGQLVTGFAGVVGSSGGWAPEVHVR